MIGFGNSDWSYDPFEKMVIFPPDPLLTQNMLAELTEKIVGFGAGGGVTFLSTAGATDGVFVFV